MSWADDELEKETTDKVKALFEKIDHCLYQDGPNENGDDDNDEDERPRTSDSFGSVDRVNPCLSEEMKGECAIWRQRFPHLRVIGKGILSNYYQVQNVPKRLNNAKSLNDSITQNRLPNPSASSIMSDISLVSLCSETQANEVDENEEILAIDGTYVDEEKSYQMMEGVTLNEKFSQDPKKYFEEKLMTAIFRKVWHKVSEKLDIVANLHSDWVLQEQVNHAPSSGQFLAIDENSIYHGGGISPLGGKLIRPSRIKSPLSDLNPVPQVYLPDLRPAIASAPPVRDYSKRPASSQNVRFAIENNQRMSRRSQSKNLTTQKRSNTATSNRPNSRLTTRNRNGKSLENKRSPSDDRKSVTIRRTRSKSGSPPSRVGSSMGFRSGIHAGQPVSLPPIFNVSNPEIMTSGPTSLTSGYSSMSSRLGTANSTSSNLTPRSSSNLRLDGKMTPSLPKSPSDRSISISGTKLKKLSHEDLGRSSRLSTKTPAHWDIRTFTPSQPRPRFRN